MCGGGMGVIKRTHGRHRVGFYGCLAYQKRGTTVCANNLLVRMENIDTAVLGTIGGDVLKPKIIDAVIAGVKDAMKPANITRETAKRKREIASLEQEIGRLTEAIALSSTPVPTLLEALQTRQRRRDELIGMVESRAPGGTQRDVRAIETAVRDKLVRVAFAVDASDAGRAPAAARDPRRADQVHARREDVSLSWEGGTREIAGRCSYQR